MCTTDDANRPNRGHQERRPTRVTFVPCLVRSMHGSEVRALSLGHPLLDDYLAFVGARARVNTWLATAYDLKVFFTVVGKELLRVVDLAHVASLLVRLVRV